jgi:hypothetical protein
MINDTLSSHICCFHPPLCTASHSGFGYEVMLAVYSMRSLPVLINVSAAHTVPAYCV